MKNTILTPFSFASLWDTPRTHSHMEKNSANVDQEEVENGTTWEWGFKSSL